MRLKIALQILRTLVTRVVAIVLATTIARAGVCQAQLGSAPSQRLELVPQIGDESFLKAIAFSPNGKFLATGGGDETVRLWDVPTGRLIRTFTGHNSEIEGIQFSPDGKTLASCSFDKTAKIWEVATGREIETLQQTDNANCVCFSPDGRTLAVGCREGATRLWDVASGKQIRSSVNGTSEVYSVCFSPDGKTLAIGLGDKTARLRDVETGRELLVLRGHTHYVSSVCFLPDGKSLITGSWDGLAKLWDIKTSRVIRTFAGHKDWIISTSVSADGQRLATGSDDKSAKIWDIATGAVVCSMPADRDVVFAPDGKSVATSLVGGAAAIWEVPSGRQLRTCSGNVALTRSALISPNRKRIATAGEGGLILWDITSGHPVQTVTASVGTILGACFSPDSSKIAVAPRDKGVTVLDLIHGTSTYLQGAVSVYAVAFSPDGKTLATGAKNSVKLWDVGSGRNLLTLSNELSYFWSVCFSPDGKTLATGSFDGTAKLWEVASGRQLFEFKPEGFDAHTRRAYIYSVSFSPDGAFLAAGLADNTSRLWSLTSGKEIRSFGAPRTDDMLFFAGNQVVTFSPDGRTLVTSSLEAAAKAWDVASGREIQSFGKPGERIYSASYSFDGKLLITAGVTTKVWDAANGRELCDLVSFEDGGWAVTDPEGRFDSSNSGDVAWLHWIVSDPAKEVLEPVDLSQFASYYYSPGLLEKVWRHTPLQTVPDLQRLPLFPQVQGLTLSRGHLKAKVADRGGGIGDVHVVVNGVDVKTAAGTPDVDIDLSAQLAGVKNPTVGVYAYNAEGSAHSRSVDLSADPQSPNPALGGIDAVIGGVQQYADSRLNLAFSDADAIAVAKAVMALADGLHVPVQIELVSGSAEAQKLASSRIHLRAPNKKGFQEAFTAASQAADSGSLYFVYLSGHGVAKSNDHGKANEFYYLTKDVNEVGSSWLSNAELVRQWSVSSKEITDYLSQALGCRRRLLVLDTCSAGASKDDFLAMRGEQEDAARARREFQEGTGTYALMGAAPDRSSFEAAEFGHGLLTYALLWTLKNVKLGDEASPNAVPANRLILEAANKTGKLASEIGRGQEATAIAPDAGQLVIGYMSDAARRAIDLHQRLPLTIRPQLINPSTGDVRLEEQLADELRSQSLADRSSGGVTPFAAYLDQSSAPRAYRLQGVYSSKGAFLSVTAGIWQDGKKCAAPFPAVSGSSKEIVTKLLEAFRKWLAKNGS